MRILSVALVIVGFLHACLGSATPPSPSWVGNRVRVGVLGAGKNSPKEGLGLSKTRYV